MKIKEISYLGPRVDLENDDLYFIEITTPKFFYTLMEKYKSDFVPPRYPYIIVSKLTDEIIRAAIQEFINEKEDSFWLKLYHITPTLNIKDINEILNQKEKENIELEKEVEREIEEESTRNYQSFHRRLEQHFPDWDRRIAYQQRQEKFYKSAMRKKRERRLETPNIYTK